MLAVILNILKNVLTSYTQNKQMTSLMQNKVFLRCYVKKPMLVGLQKFEIEAIQWIQIINKK